MIQDIGRLSPCSHQLTAGGMSRNTGFISFFFSNRGVGVFIWASYLAIQLLEYFGTFSV